MIDMLKRSGVTGLDGVPEELQPGVSDTLCDYFGKLNYIDSLVRSKENIATSYPYRDALVSKIKEEFNQYRRVRSTVPLEVFLDTLELPEEVAEPDSEGTPEVLEEIASDSESVQEVFEEVVSDSEAVQEDFEENTDESEDLSGLFEDTEEPNPYPKHKFVIASVQVEDDSEEESFDYCESDDTSDEESEDYEEESFDYCETSDDSSDTEGYSDEESDSDSDEEEFDYCSSGDESEDSDLEVVEDSSDEEESFDYCETSDDSSDVEGYSDEDSDEDEEFDYCSSGDESEVSEDSEEVEEEFDGVSDEDEEEFDGVSDEVSEESYEDNKFNYEPLPQRPVVSTPSEPPLPPEYQEIVAAEEAFRSIGSTASKLFSKVKGYYSE